MKKRSIFILISVSLLFFACPLKDTMCGLAKDGAEKFGKYAESKLTCDAKLVSEFVLKPLSEKICKSEVVKTLSSESGFVSGKGLGSTLICKVGVQALSSLGASALYDKFNCDKDKVKEMLKNTEYFCKLFST